MKTAKTSFFTTFAKRYQELFRSYFGDKQLFLSFTTVGICNPEFYSSGEHLLTKKHSWKEGPRNEERRSCLHVVRMDVKWSWSEKQLCSSSMPPVALTFFIDSSGRSGKGLKAVKCRGSNHGPNGTCTGERATDLLRQQNTFTMKELHRKHKIAQATPSNTRTSLTFLDVLLHEPEASAMLPAFEHCCALQRPGSHENMWCKQLAAACILERPAFPRFRYQACHTLQSLQFWNRAAYRLTSIDRLTAAAVSAKSLPCSC